MLRLPDVTLCCIDTRSVPAALYAVKRCLSVARFGHAFFMGSGNRPSAALPASVEWISIPELKSIQDYNNMVLKGLKQHVPTSHLLVIQWDGFIANPDLWRPDFLNWDYIGAPWYRNSEATGVGNGGFSLRSKRLLEALSSTRLDIDVPEDLEICLNQRDNLERGFGLKIAPVEVARDFSWEHGPYRSSFGIHGLHNFAHVMDSEVLRSWMSIAPPDLVAQPLGRTLVKQLFRSGRRKEARELIRLRSEHLGWGRDERLLFLRSLLPVARRPR